MARIMQCDGPDDQAAALVITLVGEAETIALCAGCGVDWAQAYLQALAPERLAAAPKKPAGRARGKTPPPPDPAADGAELQAAADATG